ncbi:MAG: hypothetical protein MJ252_13820 [archaeon]|nr:hypothetical protein [archaeon]
MKDILISLGEKEYVKKEEIFENLLIEAKEKYFFDRDSTNPEMSMTECEWQLMMRFMIDEKGLDTDKLL